MHPTLRRSLRPLLAPALLVAVVGPWGALVAQQDAGTIRGRVTATATGRPLEGAQVSIPGSTRGAVTNETGDFTITGVPAGARDVRAQRIGFVPITKSVTVVAGQPATLNFALAESPLSLEAVVVTGTAAVARKKEIGNSMATISATQIENAPIANPQQLIAGQAPGITVMQNSGQPGAGGTIRLRGNNSVSQGNNPIIYVDGVRIFSDNGPLGPNSRQQTLSMNDIKPEDIERVEIVKGAAATTLYGTEASGGVIQIFTKKGSSGRPQWTAEAAGGVNSMGHMGPSTDPTGEFMNKCNDPNLMVNSLGDKFVDPTCPASGSWLRNAPVQRYNLAVRGGSDAMTYYVSGNYNDDEGVIDPSFSKDGGFRGNFQFNPAKTLTVGLNTTYNKRQVRWVPDGNLANGLLLSVARGPNGNFKGGKGNDCAGITVTCVTNKYILDQDNRNRNDHFITGFNVTYAPTLSFTNRFNVGYDYNQQDNQLLYPFGFLAVPKGQINVYTWNHTKLSLDYAGSLLNSVFQKALASTFSWGGQLFEDRENYQVISGLDFAGPGDPTLGSAARLSPGSIARQRVINAGFFLQEQLGWKDRLFVTGGLRVDGNSAFGSNFGLQKYPKVSASYVVSESSWWPKAIETFKLRAAYGKSGKAPGAFDAVRTWDPVAADEGQPAFTPSQRGNPNLGPERTSEMEGGFDLGMLAGRLGLEVTAFHAKTDGALIGVLYPSSLGFTNSQLQNVGTLRNQGIEAQLDLGILRNQLVDWHARLSATKMSSKTINTQGQIISTGNGTYVREGFPVPAYFGSKVLNPDAFADPIISQTSDTYIGPQYPTRLASINTTITIKGNLSLDGLGEYQGGQYLVNFVGYQNALRDIWQPCYSVQTKLRAAAKGDAHALDDVRAIDRVRCQSNSIDRTKANSDFWIQPASFFKLRTVSVTYKLPQRLTPVARTASITLAGRNLWKKTNYNGNDPELQDAADAAGRLGRREYYQLPPFRTFLATLRLTF